MLEPLLASCLELSLGYWVSVVLATAAAVECARTGMALEAPRPVREGGVSSVGEVEGEGEVSLVVTEVVGEEGISNRDNIDEIYCAH